MAFNQLQIIANDTYLDTYDNWDVALTYQVLDIVDITKRTTSFSKTIIIPGTAKNNDFFQNIFDVNVDLAVTSYNPKISVPAQIRIGDQLVFDGNLQILQIIQNQKMVEYEIIITGILKNILYNFGDYYLTQLNLDEYNHTRSISAITNSWNYIIVKNGSTINTTGLGEGYVYPYIVNGNSQDIATTSYVADQYPAIYVKTIIDKMFQFAGYTYTSNFFNSDYFKKLVIPFTNDKLQETAENISGRTTTVSVNAALPEPASIFNAFTLQAYQNSAGVTGYRQFMPVMKKNSGWQNSTNFGRYIPLDLETGSVGGIPLQDPNNAWTVSNSIFNQTRYVNQQAGFYSIDFNMDIILKFIQKNGNNISHNSGSFSYIAGIYKKTSATGVWQQIIQSPASSTGTITPSGGVHASPWYDIANPININMFVPNIYLEVGDQIQVNFSIQYPSNVNWAGGDANTYMVVLVSNTNNNDPNYLSIKPSSNTISNPITDMPMSQILPAMKMKDFFLSLSKMFNLIVTDNPNKSNDVIVEPRDDYYESKRKVKDWTYKLDRSSDIIQVPMSELDIRGYSFAYDVDDDFYNKQYNEETKRYYADYEVDFINEFSNEVQEIKINFAPTPDTDNFISTRVAPFFADIAEDNALSPRKVKPRILFYDGLKNGSSYTLKNSSVSTGITYNQYPYVGMWDDALNPQYDLAFGSAEKVYYNTTNYPTQTLVELFYKNTLTDIQDVNAKLLKGYFDLSVADIQDFDFRDIIFIDNAYYRVNKISDYNPVKTDRLTLVELYKISNIDYYVAETVSIPNSNNDCPSDVIAKRVKYQGWIYVSSSGQILGEDCCNQLGGVWTGGFCKAIVGNVGWGTGYGNDAATGVVGTGIGSTKPLISTGGFLKVPIKEERPLSLIKDQTINNGISVQTQGTNNYVAQQTKNGLVIGSNNTVIPTIENVLVIGDGITPTQSNSLIVGDLLITSDGLQWNTVYIIDAGLNTVMNDAKTNLIDIIDGGFNSVRNFGGESKLRPIIDGTEPADNGFIEY